MRLWVLNLCSVRRLRWVWATFLGKKNQRFVDFFQTSPFFKNYFPIFSKLFYFFLDYFLCFENYFPPFQRFIFSFLKLFSLFWNLFLPFKRFIFSILKFIFTFWKFFSKKIKGRSSFFKMASGSFFRLKIRSKTAFILRGCFRFYKLSKIVILNVKMLNRAKPFV